MYKKFVKSVFLLCLVSMVSVLLSSYENEGKLKIKGVVKDPDGEFIDEEITVTLKEFGKEVSKTSTNAVGKFSLEVDYQKTQTLHFDAKGYVSMHIQIDSRIPLPKSDKNYTISPYLNLLSDTVKNINLSVFRKPFTRIVYFPIDDFFDVDASSLDEFIAESNEDPKVYIKASLSANDSIPVKKGKANIIVDEKVVESVEIDSTGAFEFKLFYDKKATVELEVDGYYPSYIELDTKAPSNFSASDFEFSPVIKIISKSTEYINPKAFDLPVTQFKFNEDSAKITYNTAAIDTFQTVLDESKKLPIEVYGNVVDSAGSPLKAIQVRLKDGDEELAYMETKKNGSYILKAPFDKDMYLEFSNELYHKNIVELNTERESKEFKKIELEAPEITMYLLNDAYVDEKTFDEPVAYLEYQDSTNNFTADQDVIEKFEKSLDKVIETNTPIVELANEEYPVEYKYVALKGTVEDVQEGRELDSATVKVFVGPVEVHSVTTNKKGQYNISLNYEKTYRIEVKRKGFFNMQFEFDTHIPEEDRTRVAEQESDVSMFSKESGMNPFAFKMLFNKVYHDTLVTKRIEFANDLQVQAAFGDILKQSEEDMLPKILVLNLQVEGYSKRKHKELNIFLKLGEEVVDTMEVDRDGKFTAEVDFNENYSFSFEGEGFYTSFVELTTVAPGEGKLDTVSTDPVKVFSKIDDYDPLIFQNPASKLDYNASASSISVDSSVINYFYAEIDRTAKLAELSTKRLSIIGYAKDLTDRRLKGVMVYLVEDGEKVDSIETNRRGVYEFKGKFQKTALLKFESSRYYSTFVDLNTTMLVDSIKDMSANINAVTLVPKSEPDIDNKVFNMPNQKVYYTVQDNTFVNDSMANDNFLKVLFEPKREKERRLAELKKANAAKKIVTIKDKSKQLGTLTAGKMKPPKMVLAKIPEEDDFSAAIYDDAATREEKQKEASLASTAAGTQDFLLSMFAVDTSKVVIDIQDVQLSAEELDDFEFVELELPEPDLPNEQLEEQQQEFINFNNILADLFTRRGLVVDNVPIDSTFNATRPLRVYYTPTGQGVFQKFSHRIITDGKKIEMTHKLNWFFVDYYYIGTEEVTETEYLSVLGNYNIKLEQN